VSTIGVPVLGRLSLYLDFDFYQHHCLHLVYLFYFLHLELVHLVRSGLVKHCQPTDRNTLPDNVFLCQGPTPPFGHTVNRTSIGPSSPQNIADDWLVVPQPYLLDTPCVCINF